MGGMVSAGFFVDSAGVSASIAVGASVHRDAGGKNGAGEGSGLEGGGFVAGAAYTDVKPSPAALIAMA